MLLCLFYNCTSGRVGLAIIFSKQSYLEDLRESSSSRKGLCVGGVHCFVVWGGGFGFYKHGSKGANVLLLMKITKVVLM